MRNKEEEKEEGEERGREGGGSSEATQMFFPEANCIIHTQDHLMILF